MSWPLGLRRAVALAIGVFIGSAFALGQEASGPPAKDTIFARKILMGAIDMKMEEIETMLAPNGKFDAAEAQEHADTISIMLMSFPHLFSAAPTSGKKALIEIPRPIPLPRPSFGRILRIFISVPRRPRTSPSKPALPSAWMSLGS